MEEVRRIVRARKEHLCSWHPYKADEHGNYHAIMPGEYYEKVAQFRDGTVTTWRSCAYHREAAQFVFDTWGMDELTDYELTDSMYEMWSDATYHEAHGMPYQIPFDAHASLRPTTKA